MELDQTLELGSCSATGNNKGCFLQGKPAETESGHIAHQFVPKASVTLFFSVCVLLLLLMLLLIFYIFILFLFVCLFLEQVVGWG